MKCSKFENDALFQCFAFSAVCRSEEETKNLLEYTKNRAMLLFVTRNDVITSVHIML